MRVAVYCGSSDEVPAAFLAQGEEVGRLLAGRGHTVVYGGGRVGVMGAVARGARGAGGRVVGVILDRFVAMGVADPEVREMAVVADMRSRKRGLEDQAQAHLVLPGGVGTMDELFEILSLRYLGLNGNPLVLLDLGGFYAALLELLETMSRQGFLKGGWRRLLAVAATPAEALALLEDGRG